MHSTTKQSPRAVGIRQFVQKLRKRSVLAAWMTLGLAGSASHAFAQFGGPAAPLPASNLTSPVYTVPNNYSLPAPQGTIPQQPGVLGAPGIIPNPGAPQYGYPTQPPPNLGFGSPVGAAPPTPIYGPGVAPPTQPIYPNNQPMVQPGPMNQPMSPLNVPWQIEPNTGFMSTAPFGYNPRVRDATLTAIVDEGQTVRFSVGGSVNSDLGVAGQIVLEERNFDLWAWPNRPRDLFNGAFRGNGQNFRLELVPGNQVQRYTVNWTEPSLFDTPFSLSLGGFYFTRYYRDWSEQRLGGRAALGYDITPDLSVSTELRGEDVKIYNPRISGVPKLDNVLGSNDLYTGRFRIAHNTRDSPFLPTEGHLLEMIYDQVFGEFDFPRGQVNYSKYFLVRERADGSGRHTFTTAFRTGFAGSDQPIFENFFAGGFSTMRGFAFRGASPVEGNVQVGGRFQFLGTFEYMFPITADDMFRMVAFVDYGTVEKDIKIDWNNFRVAPGLGFRIAVPALGPAPLAFDFAFPVNYADTDTRQIFSFTMGMTR